MEAVDQKHLIDKLTIEMLDLIEQQVKCKVNLENLVVQGQLQIAKTRYTQGTRSVSTAQLPTENSQQFKALRTIERTQNEIGDVQVKLAVQDVDRDQGYIDPTNWFGILVPQSLQLAKEAFRKSIEYSCECANIQLCLWRTMTNILLLKRKLESN